MSSCVAIDLTLRRLRPCSAVEIVRSHQQLQAELTGDLRVGHTLLLAVFLLVVQIFDYFLEYDAVDVFEMTFTADRFAKVAYELLVSCCGVALCGRRTVHVEHPTDRARSHGCRPSDVELEAIGRDQSYIRGPGGVGGSHNDA